MHFFCDKTLGFVHLSVSHLKIYHFKMLSYLEMCEYAGCDVTNPNGKYMVGSNSAKVNRMDFGNFFKTEAKI